MWKKPTHYLNQTQETSLVKASRRVAKMQDSELLEMADAVGSGLAKGLDDYRRLDEQASLDEVLEGLIALQALVLELKLRDAARRS